MLLIQLGKRLAERLNFDRVSQAGSCAVAFNESNRRRVDLRFFIGFNQKSGLSQ